MAPGALEWLRNTSADDWPAEYKTDYEKLSPDGAEHWPVVIERLKKMWLETEAWPIEDFQRISAPTMVIGGDNDIKVEHLVQMYRAIPNARLCILPGTGHETLSGRSTWLNPILLSFFEEPLPKK